MKTMTQTLNVQQSKSGSSRSDDNIVGNRPIASRHSIRQDFPILQRQVHGKPLAYLDNAATSQKPQQVLAAMMAYYEHSNANVHRGLHKLSEEATLAYESAHTTTASFIGAAEMEEIIFTKNTTESLNLLAYSLGRRLHKGDEIVLTQMEHHSNLVPWQQIAKQIGATLKFIPITPDGLLDMEKAHDLITNKTKIVSLVHMSNVLGTINPIKGLAKVAHDHNALCIVDAAQSVPHFPVDVKKLDCDFLAFSGHKMLGPTGIGVLYGKRHLLEEMDPFLYGGDMIREVHFDRSTWNDLPWKFEAGTPLIAQGIGLAAAIDYLQKIGMDVVEQHEKELTKYAYDQLTNIPHIQIYGPSPDKRGGVISFNIDGIHAHDVAAILDQDGIAIRGGHHCAMPLMDLLGIVGSARASFYIYNTKEEIDRLVESIKRAKKIFGM